MDVEIGEVSSSVHTTDSGALLHPKMIEQLVRMVLGKLKDAQEHEKRVNDEKDLRPGASADESKSWD
jgi:hypothetical protein